MDITHPLGSVPAPIDLHTMLRNHLVRRSNEMLAAGAARRENALADRARPLRPEPS